MSKRQAGGVCALIAAALIAGPLAAQASEAFPKAARAGPPRFNEADSIAQAIANPGRSPQFRERDPWRKPAESLAFWGLQPGDSIVELQPGGGYWTEILAAFAKATGGKYVGTGADLNDPNTPEQAKKARADFEARQGVQTVGFGPRSGPLAPAGSVDFVLSARSVHGWIRTGQVDKVMADVSAALKPGGVFALEQHRADPRAMAENASDGYVSARRTPRRIRQRRPIRLRIHQPRRIRLRIPRLQPIRLRIHRRRLRTRRLLR